MNKHENGKAQMKRLVAPCEMFWFAAGVSVLRKSYASDGMLGNLGIQIEQADVAKKLQAR